jgi:hypothetical protein
MESQRRGNLEGSGGLWAIGERKESGGTAGSTGCGAGGIFLVFGRRGRLSCFRGQGRIRGGRSGIGRSAVGVQILDADNILIGDFPAKLFLLPTLFEMFFEEDGTAGIGDKSARRGQKDIAGAVLHLDPAPEKGGIAGHTVASVGRGGRGVNSTEGLLLTKVWKTDRSSGGASLRVRMGFKGTREIRKSGGTTGGSNR